MGAGENTLTNDAPPISATRIDHLLFMAVTLLYWASLYMYVPILSPYLDSLGSGFGMIGVILGSYGFVQLAIRLPLGLLSDRMRVRKPFIILGMLTGGLSCLLFAAVPQFGWALAARSTAGVSASTWVAFTVLYASYFPKRQTTRAMSQISLMTVAGQLIGMGLSGYLADEWGWAATFWAGAAAGALGLALSLCIKEPKQGVEREPIRLRDIGRVLREPLLRKVSLLSILAHSVLFITMFGFTPSQAISLGAGPGGLSLLVFAFMIPHGLASLLAGQCVAPRIGNWATLFIGYAGAGLCTICIPLLHSFDSLVVTQIFNGWFQGMCFPLLLGMAIEPFETKLRATAMGFYQAVYSAGMFAGPFVAGWMNAVFGLAGGFYLGGAAAFAATGLSLLWGLWKKPSSTRQTASPGG